VLYKLTKLIVNLVFLIYFRRRVYGRENIPRRGGCLIATNHVSYADPLLVGAACPRPVHFMAKAELFRVPILRAILPCINAFPVNRGAADRQAIKKSLALLENGEIVGVFPEGTRNRGSEMLPLHGGAAMFALKTGVPVIPAAVWGTGRIDGPWHLPKPVQIGIRFGPPIHLPHVEQVKKENVVEASRIIMDSIKKLLDDCESRPVSCA
jgi:1-acyl-sn-glycerol-3-phosphate acyltransferase